MKTQKANDHCSKVMLPFWYQLLLPSLGAMVMLIVVLWVWDMTFDPLICLAVMTGAFIVLLVGLKAYNNYLTSKRKFAVLQASHDQAYTWVLDALQNIDDLEESLPKLSEVFRRKNQEADNSWRDAGLYHYAYIRVEKALKKGYIKTMKKVEQAELFLVMTERIAKYYIQSRVFFMYWLARFFKNPEAPIKEDMY